MKRGIVDGSDGSDRSDGAAPVGARRLLAAEAMAAAAGMNLRMGLGLLRRGLRRLSLGFAVGGFVGVWCDDGVAGTGGYDTKGSGHHLDGRG